MQMNARDPLEGNPQILRTKKDAELYDDGEVDREKPPVLPPPPEPRKPPRSLLQSITGIGTQARGRRKPLAALLPVAILAATVYLIIRFMPPHADHAAIGGSEAMLRAAVAGNSILAAVAVSPQEGGAAQNNVEVTVVFQLPDTGGQLTVKDALSESGVILKAQMGYTGKERSIRARVTIGEKTAELYADIPSVQKNP
jgi:hypothetical protein